MDFFSIGNIFTILLGLVIGSFLSVCIYRLPIGRFDAEDEDGEAIPSDKEKLSIFYPVWSFCPECEKTLKWYHNIPILSYLFLRGKCAYCKEKIPFRYPLVEILSAIAIEACVYKFGFTLEAYLLYFFIALLIVMSFIDIDYFILPNIITYPLSIIGFILATINGFFHFLGAPFAQNINQALIGLLAPLFLFVVSYVHAFIRKKEGLGMGDIKLLICFGLFFGIGPSFLSIMFGSFIACIGTILFRIFSKKGLAEPLPFGPYLSLGLVVALFTDVYLPIGIM